MGQWINWVIKLKWYVIPFNKSRSLNSQTLIYPHISDFRCCRDEFKNKRGSEEENDRCLKVLCFTAALLMCSLNKKKLQKYENSLGEYYYFATRSWLKENYNVKSNIDIYIKMSRQVKKCDHLSRETSLLSGPDCFLFKQSFLLDIFCSKDPGCFATRQQVSDQFKAGEKHK